MLLLTTGLAKSSTLAPYTSLLQTSLTWQLDITSPQFNGHLLTSQAHYTEPRGEQNNRAPVCLTS